MLEVHPHLLQSSAGTTTQQLQCSALHHAAMTMNRRVVLSMYRCLLKEAREVSRTGPITIQESPFPIEAPILIGSVFVHHNALRNALPPSALPHASTLSHNELVGAMTGHDIAAVIKATFRAGAAEEDESTVRELVNEIFMGLRTLGEQRRLQNETSVTVTDGLRVTATSQFHAARVRQVPSVTPQPSFVHVAWDFKYRIRIDNVGDEAATVLGREWRIINEDGVIEHEILRGMPIAQRVVGLRPVIKPGTSFVYCSHTDLTTQCGRMEGCFQVARGEIEDPDSFSETELDMFDAKVSPFQLVTPERHSDVAQNAWTSAV